MIEFNTRDNGAVPFWFWNGDQQEGEITRQLELAAQGGLKRGRRFMRVQGIRPNTCPSAGVALTRHTCEQAKRLGLDIWLYDEEGDISFIPIPFLVFQLAYIAYYKGLGLQGNEWEQRMEYIGSVCAELVFA